MHAFAAIASLALLLAASVHASVYVTNPVQSTTCAGGQPCTVQWVDNGEAPLLPQIGECDVGLYTGNYVLVQSLPSVNVATSSSFQFTPNPDVGTDGQYYLVFSASSINYVGFSGSFALSGLSGTTPSGGSSTPASTPATTKSGLTTTAGSSTPATTPTDTNTATTPSGTSNTPSAATTTPTSSTSTAETTTPTLTMPTVTTPTSSMPTSTIPATTTTSRTSTSASATATSGAGHVASTSLGGAVALFVLSAVFAF